MGSNHRFRSLNSIKVLQFSYKCFIFMCFQGTTSPLIAMIRVIFLRNYGYEGL